jgi:toxin ParE1/3/4
MSYQKAALVDADLIGIWTYTANNFGEIQADKYLRLLEKGFQKIGKGDTEGKQPLPKSPDVRVIRCEHHYIFFLKRTPPLILAVLHERMDLIARLKNRLE